MSVDEIIQHLITSNYHLDRENFFLRTLLTVYTIAGALCLLKSYLI